MSGDDWTFFLTKCLNFTKNEKFTPPEHTIFV